MVVDKKTGLRIAFMGTPEFSVPILDALVAAGHQIICVYTQPPRNRGRGQKEQKTQVHLKAEKLGLDIYTPNDFDSDEQQVNFANFNLDCAVVVAYGLVLPRPILVAPRFGCINIHASLLPRWRGAAPIQRAILAGDAESGVTIMQMDEGLDTGNMLKVDKVKITPTTTGKSLHDALSQVGSALIIKTLDCLVRGKLRPVKQPRVGVTYAKKLERLEGFIDWERPADELERSIRAFTPWPGSWFEVRGERIKVLSAHVKNINGPPGKVIDNKMTIACGIGGLQLRSLQRAGKKPMTSSEFLRGFDLPSGTFLN